MSMLGIGTLFGAEPYLARPGSVQGGVPQYWFDDDGTSLTIQTGPNPVQVRRMGHRSDTSTVNADQVFNRGIKRGDTILVTGDKPRFALARTLPEAKMDPDIHKLGDGRIRIRCGGAAVWLDECDAILTTFRPSRTEYVLKTAKVEGLVMSLWVSQAADWGFVSRLTVSNAGPDRLEVSAEFLYGGLSTHGRTMSAAYFKAQDQDSAGNAVELDEALGRSATKLFKVFAAMTPPVKPTNAGGRLSFVSALPLQPGESQSVALCGGWAVPERDIEKEVRSAQPQALIDEAAAYYATMLGKAVISTPSQVLDNGFRNAVLNLDYIWAHQAWLEGVHWWAAYWANNYQISAAISLDQREKARTAFRFFGHGAEGPGPIGIASGLSNEGYDALPYYLYQLAQYYDHTGDDALVKELWPGLVKGVDRFLAATDPDNDGLSGFHLHCNAFLYQADHLGLPGAAASPSLMIGGMLARWSRIADEVGQKEQAQQWRDRAAKTHAGVRKTLWNPEAGCFYSHVDQEGVQHMAHYYTDHVFPLLYSQLPEEYGWSSLAYLRSSLCFESGTSNPLNQPLLLMRVGNLKPTVFGNDNVMPVQMAEAARACFRAGDFNTGTRMLDSVALTGTVFTEAPGNFPERMGDDGKGEANYLFGNPIGSFIYGVVDGLFGLSLVERGKTVRWQPGFPDAWNHAELRLPYVQVRFSRETGTVSRCRYTVTTPEARKLELSLQLPPSKIRAASINGKTVAIRPEPGLNRVRLALTAPAATSHEILIDYEPMNMPASLVASGTTGEPLQWTCAAAVGEIKDPQGVVKDVKISGTNVAAVLIAQPGQYTLYVRQREPCVWAPVTIRVKPGALTACRKSEARPIPPRAAGEATHTLDLAPFRNASTIHVTSFWRDEEQKQGGGSGNTMAMLEVGRSDPSTGITKPSVYLRQLSLPVNKTCVRFNLRYVCEAASRNTRTRVGAVVFAYAGGRTEAVDLVVDGNLRVASWGGGGGSLELGCDPNALLETVTIRLAAADVQVGVFEALVGERKSGENAPTLEAKPQTQTPKPLPTERKWVELVRDTFDSQKVGDVPVGWKLDTAAGGISVQNVSASTDKCSLISDSSATAGSSMSRSFAPQSGKIRVEASVRQEAKNHGMEMTLSNAAVVRMHSNGELHWIDADGEHTLQQFTPGVFYRVRIDADIPAGVFDVYVDNEARASRAPFMAKTNTLDSLTFQSWGSTSGTNYVDDVVVAREETETKK